MSTIADYSVFTKKFLSNNNVDFSKPYGKLGPDGNWGEAGDLKAFAVVPLYLDPTLTPREALNLGQSSWESEYGNIEGRISCRDADGNFIGNIVRIQPGVREGSIRLVAKVAVPAASEGDVADIKVNTFVLLRAGSTTNGDANFATAVDLPIAVATISAGYTLHKHLETSEIDPLDDVENANYVSFTINNLNGYTSVDFNPDAYATYDDVANALSRGIDGLHIAFDTASGDLKLLDKDGNVLDQANLPIKTDVIIADGEEGYKYVKTDVKQDIHAAKAWMPEGKTAWESVPEAPYEMKHAALVVEKVSSRVFVSPKADARLTISTQTVKIPHVVIDDSTYMLDYLTGSTCNLFRVKGDAGSPAYHDVPFTNNTVTIPDASTGEPSSQGVTISDSDVEKVDVITYEGSLYVLGETDNTRVLGETVETSEYLALPTNSEVSNRFSGWIETSGVSSTGGVLGITIKGDVKTMYTFDGGAQPHAEITSISGDKVRWLDRKPLTEVPNHTLKYGLEAFVWTVKGDEYKSNDPFFQQLNESLRALGFHEGDDIALGTNLATLVTAEGDSPLNGVDADEYIHGKDNKAKREQEVNKQRANAKEELVAWNARHPALTENRSDGTIIDHTGLDVRHGSITLGCGHVPVGVEDESTKVNYGLQMNDRSEHLDFTVSHHTGPVQFDENGHAIGLTSSTLLSIEAGDYISGAPTCLILAEVTNSSGTPWVTPIRTTTGFECVPSYDASSGSRLKIHDYRNNIAAVFNPYNYEPIPAIIEVQAIYTHSDAQSETVPAQQMHTYIGEWKTISAVGAPDHPCCSFLCNKIEEWMTAVGLTDTNPVENVKLYVVIRVY